MQKNPSIVYHFAVQKVAWSIKFVHGALFFFPLFKYLGMHSQLFIKLILTNLMSWIGSLNNEILPIITWNFAFNQNGMTQLRVLMEQTGPCVNYRAL